MPHTIHFIDISEFDKLISTSFSAKTEVTKSFTAKCDITTALNLR